MPITIFLIKRCFPCFLLLLFVSCKSNSKTDKIILQEIEEGLLRTNSLLHIHSSNIIESLKLKSFDPRTKEKAEIWLPKAEKVQQSLMELYEYITGLKTVLRKHAGMDEINKGDNTNAPVNTVFIKNKKADELYTKLRDYRKNILSTVNESVRDEFNKVTIIVNRQLDTIQQGLEKFKEDYFTSSNSYQVLTYLGSIQNNILTAANRCIIYCNENVASNHDFFESFEAIVGQNAQILKAGNQLEITAGLGAFSKTKLPQITINNQPIALDERGIVVYKMKTSKKPGNYSIPVNIEFTDQDGKKQMRTFNVEYTLVEELKKN